MTLKAAVLSVMLCVSAQAQLRAIVPPNAAPSSSPFTPGVFAGDYLYVSGQGGSGPKGETASTFEAQVRQALENVKSVVEAAGLTLKNVVYTQVYLDNMIHFDAMNRVYAEYFRDTPPARATIGVAGLVGGTSIEITAVAVRDASVIEAVAVTGRRIDEPVSAGILTNDRLFISAMPGKPSNAEAQVDDALNGMKSIVEAAGLKLANVVFVNPYLTRQMPAKIMNRLYARRFEFGNTPARATIEVTSLPLDAQIEFTGVAVRDLSRRHAVRPRNMPPSPTASPCVFAGDTLYCSAKSGFIPGLNGGVFTPDVKLQLRQTMRNLLDNLEEAGLTFNDVVSTNVYLDNLADFSLMNELYSKYFRGILPARTTIQQIAPADRSKRDDDTYADLEQISLIAVKPPPK
ncbi:MAG TPA: RidA family protein [Bryobacteraceae bacterium]|jgi:reactive intermediate/imine deaminase|nr:RidA family protein [Bryobacteraceae bacterium]